MNKRKKFFIYCQHVLGIGHLARMAALLKELQAFEVTLVLGGPESRVVFPENIDIVQLPGLQMDAEFSGLQPVDTGASLAAIKEKRKKILVGLIDSLQPDLLLIELFPFGRCGFRFELDPLLSHVHEHLPDCRVVCSVRDILVERDNRIKFEQRAVERLNRFFDLLLIHADPEIVKLDQTFSRMEDIRIPVQYTGYIAEKREHEVGVRLRISLGLEPGEQLVVVSAGSGSVGNRLLESALAAYAIQVRKHGQKLRLQLFSGPYLKNEHFSSLLKLAGPGAVVERFTDRFSDWLAAADLSISMGGYNTTMNVVAAGCPALIFPFSQNREQRLRAECLSAQVPVEILEKHDLLPERLGKKMEMMLQVKKYSPQVSLNGAEETSRLLAQEANYD